MMTAEESFEYEYIVENGICNAKILNAWKENTKLTWLQVFNIIIKFVKGYNTFDEYYNTIMEE